MDESRRSLIQVIQFIRFTLRGYFGESFADKWGFFVDRNMSTEIHSYLDWIEYPMGGHVLEGHTGEVQCAVITRDGCYLFTGSEDESIIKWNLITNEIVTQIEAGIILSLAHTPGILISAGSDGKIKVWNDDGDYLIRTMVGHTSGVDSLCLINRGTTLVSGSSDFTCRLWSVQNGECLRVMEGHSDFVTGVLFADDVVISGSLDESIRLWDPDSGKEVRKITERNNQCIFSLSLNCHSSILLWVHSGGFTLFKWPIMEEIGTVLLNTYHCCFHPSNPSILAVSDLNDYSIRVYSTDNTQLVHTLVGHTGIVRGITFSPDGYRLISVSDDKTARVWDVSALIL